MMLKFAKSKVFRQFNSMFMDNWDEISYPISFVKFDTYREHYANLKIAFYSRA